MAKPKPPTNIVFYAIMVLVLIVAIGFAVTPLYNSAPF